MGRRARLLVAILGTFYAIAFVATRLFSLDRDIPPWRIAQYSGIDEFMYTVAGFNLANHGSWTYRALSYVTDDSTPLNVLQNVVTGLTLTVAGNNFYGLRLPSVLFGVGCVAAMAYIAWRMLAEAREKELLSSRRAWFIAAFWALVLLLDFPFLLATRISEPTISRTFASLVVLAALVSPKMLAPEGGRLRTVALGALTAAAVLWVYLYNAFLVPSVVLVVVWRFRRDLRAATGQLLALLVGGIAGASTYFAWVWWTYGQSPLDWHRFWVAAYSTDRAPGWGAERWLIDTNVFRLDRPFMLVVLMSVPVIVWALRRQRLRAEVPVVAITVVSVTQSLYVFDYGLRKGVAFFPLFVLCGLIAAVHLEGFLSWLTEYRGRAMSVLPYAAVSLGVIAWLIPLGLDTAWSRGFTLLPWIVVLNAGAAVMAAVALGGMALSRGRGPVFAGTAAVLLVAILVPSVVLDARYVFTQRAFHWKELNQRVAAIEGEAVLAGGWSYAVRLYGDVEPCEGRYLYGEDYGDHMRILKRVFERGDAQAAYYHNDSRSRGEMGRVGLRLYKSFPEVRLPRARVLGRYVPKDEARSSGATATP